MSVRTPHKDHRTLFMNVVDKKYDQMTHIVMKPTLKGPLSDHIQQGFEPMIQNLRGAAYPQKTTAQQA